MFGRMFSGERMFQNIYTAKGEEGMIAFASCFPGSIKAFDVSKGDMVMQKKAFLASEAGVELSVFFNKRVGSGLFGGEGFIMQRLSGKGIAFAEFDGHVIEYDLEAGEGFFNTVIHGPGKVWLQTMPICNMAGALIPYLPTSGGN